jgi:hypothetical protein
MAVMLRGGPRSRAEQFGPKKKPLVRLINLGTPPLDVDEHGAVEGLVSFDAAEVDQPHLVVKVRFLQHALPQKFQVPWGMEYNRTRTPILNQTIHNA